MQLYLFYPIILILGISTSFTDIKFHIIKNRHIIIALIVAFILYLYLIARGIIVYQFTFLLNPLVALMISFFLFWADMWGPGDAKLFFAYSILLPINRYPDLFPLSCINLFINIFLISAAFILCSMIKEIFKHRNFIIKNAFSLKAILNFLKRFAITFSFAWIVWPIINSIKFKIDPYLKILILFIFYKIIVMKLISKIQESYSLVILSFIIGLLLRCLSQSQALYLSTLIQYLIGTIGQALLLYILGVGFNPATKFNNSYRPTEIIPSYKKTVPFAPFMLIGTLAANTSFIINVMRMLSFLKK